MHNQILSNTFILSKKRKPMKLSKYISVFVLAGAALALTACGDDPFNSFADPRPEVEISFPNVSDQNAPLVVRANTATNRVGSIPVEVRISSRNGKVPRTAYVDALYSSTNCSPATRAFRNFSYLANQPLAQWVGLPAGQGPMGAPIAIANGGPETTFTYTWDPAVFAGYFLSRPDRVGDGTCASEDHRIRFVVEFTDGTVAVSYQLWFRFTR
jgi:hypothetical protein